MMRVQWHTSENIRCTGVVIGTSADVMFLLILCEQDKLIYRISYQNVMSILPEQGPNIVKLSTN